VKETIRYICLDTIFYFIYIINTMEIPILFENNDYLAINKPAGLVVHPDGRTKEPTVVDWLLERYPEIKDVGEPLTLASGEVLHRPGIVHRIDRETSGVLLIAKNQPAFLALKSQFQNREIEKVYHAFIYGELPDEEGSISRPIGRSSKDFRLWSAQRGAKGQLREAVTNYKVLRHGGGFSYIQAEPKTGRTHQIRVHFKAINFPLVCDRLYAPKREPALGFQRLALHASSITFHLLDGTEQKVEAPLPADFQAALAMLPKE
jgi:23S rRNA pseudouridine1911/1915/1917 synthase